MLIGLLSNTEWLRGSVELTEHGEIITDTSSPISDGRSARQIDHSVA
ncbi:hypothetical protein ACE0DR_04280 [Azotobacter sp. CWF10]